MLTMSRPGKKTNQVFTCEWINARMKRLTYLERTRCTNKQTKRLRYQTRHRWEQQKHPKTIRIARLTGHPVYNTSINDWKNYLHGTLQTYKSHNGRLLCDAQNNDRTTQSCQTVSYFHDLIRQVSANHVTAPRTERWLMQQQQCLLELNQQLT